MQLNDFRNGMECNIILCARIGLSALSNRRWLQLKPGNIQHRVRFSVQLLYAWYFPIAEKRDTAHVS